MYVCICMCNEFFLTHTYFHLITNIYIYIYIYIHTYIYIYAKKEGHTHKHYISLPHRHTDTQTHRHADTQTTQRHTDTDTDTDTHTHTFISYGIAFITPRFSLCGLTNSCRYDIHAYIHTERETLYFSPSLSHTHTHLHLISNSFHNASFFTLWSNE